MLPVAPGGDKGGLPSVTLQAHDALDLYEDVQGAAGASPLLRAPVP